MKFYHAAKNKFLPDILRNGLRVSSLETGREREDRDGLPKGYATGILYLSTDLEHLVIDPKNYQGKYTLLEIDVPESIYNGWTKGVDPVLRYYKTGERYAIEFTKNIYSRHPEKFEGFKEEIIREVRRKNGDFWKDIFPRSKRYKEMIKIFNEFTKYTLVIKQNIPKKYIKIYG